MAPAPTSTTITTSHIKKNTLAPPGRSLGLMTKSRTILQSPNTPMCPGTPETLTNTRRTRTPGARAVLLAEEVGAGLLTGGAGADPLTRGAGPLTKEAGPLTKGGGPLTRGAGPLTRGVGPMT